ncbi:MAG: glutamate-1-semialdehyde 2,1-aminomutase [Nitrospirae bacterium]|nr:glutamate-1-semialdehyde 2,1-aminomutase [Nitrospirota bacterium]
MDFSKSGALKKKFHEIIPGGAHTYAKGDDQFPEFALPYIVRGEGCHVWDADGNEFIEYGMGLRAVTLGHAYKTVVDAACRQMLLGSNFNRPSVIELECAEELLSLIEGAEMVKFGKNGSDVTSAAIKLSRAYTGRDIAAICGDHPFFSADDWFIGTTPMSSGIPKAVQDLTVKFKYNDIESVKTLFQQHHGKIACLIMEPEKDKEPVNNFLHEVQKICRENGTVFVLDEMITGFRWNNGGGQGYYNITPDLSAFGKAMGNGFSVSALAGKRELMQLGGLSHNRERVFLLSLTHGAETHSLAAALETMRIYIREPVVDFLWLQGERLSKGINRAIDEHRLNGFFEIIGKPCCLVYATRDKDMKPSQAFRTLLLHETMKRGIMATSLVVSYSHTDADIDRTIDAFYEVLYIYRKALDEGIDKYFTGRPVKPVWRRHN